MYNEQLRETVPPPSQVLWESVAKLPFSSFTILVLVNLLKFTDTPIRVSDIFYISLTFKFINFDFKYSFFLFLKYLLSSRLILFTLSKLLWFGCCNLCTLACFFWSKFINLLLQTMVYAASVHTDVDCL